MREADQLLDDETLVEFIYDAQGTSRALSRKRGRKQTPAEVVLRLLMLKHVRNWSFDTLEREVRANLVYRDFTRIGTEKVPDAKVMGKIARVIGPEVVQAIASAVGGPGGGAKVGARTQDAGGHHGGGNQHSLSNRQHALERWHARTDEAE